MRARKIKTEETTEKLARLLSFPTRKRRPRKAAPTGEVAQVLNLADYRKRPMESEAAKGSMSYFPGYGAFYTYWMWVPVWKIS